MDRTISRFRVLHTPVTSVPERLGNLDRKRAHAAGCAVHENLLTGLDPPGIAKTLQGGECRHGDGGSFFEREIDRFQRQSVFSSRCKLGKTTRGGPKDLIPWLKLRHVVAYCFHLSGDVRAEPRVFWLA
jgi:hypothetical protein